MKMIRTYVKYCLYLFPLLVVFPCFFGCSKQMPNKLNSTNLEQSQSYGNLDLENVKITENTPESGKWQILEFDYKFISADTLTTMQETADAYGSFPLDSNHILCDVWLNDNESTDIPYAEMTADKYDSTLYMRYIDNDLYMDINLAGKLEIYNRKSLKDILDISFNGTWSWRPSFNGSVIKKYDFLTELVSTDSYQLNGTDVSVNDALAYASDYLNSKELPYITSKLCTYTPLNAEVYKFSEESYGYYFTFQLNYDGVPIDVTQGANFENNYMFSNTIKLLMLTKSSVDWIWTCAWNADTPTLQEPCEVTIDYEEACQILSDCLSQEHTFTVKEAELLYCTREIPDEISEWGLSGIIAEPMWQFTITNVGVQEYSVLYVNVNAHNGEVYMRYE